MAGQSLDESWSVRSGPLSTRHEGDWVAGRARSHVRRTGDDAKLEYNGENRKGSGRENDLTADLHNSALRIVAAGTLVGVEQTG